ncbi:pilus assembly protein CpaB [Roseomonas alkaliterrae]|jgi:pilus assembly protein CpaB|uniref:Pilus assembly protein CpaB n=1 Tax=Neoroseomonas alkaliterrae TaxID=1452450 RepID=A0A840XNY8_9PROT|nr:Flp pilus assembly protein CpaB [Neoroseomonas alkaliterrae]MBB5690298.1 pilus assembly protein CpaB [Neoroseomonas alkaliterrae]
MFLRILVIFSLVLSATGLGILAMQLMQPPQYVPQVARVEAPPVVAPAPRVRMLVAARPLSIGTLLKDDDLREMEVSGDSVPDGAFVGGQESLAELRGALLRRFVDPNTPIVRTDVLRPRDRGFLAAVLRPGTRAISIGVDVVTGASGLIWPGDEVDLILTQNLNTGDQGRESPGRRVVGETILSAVRVIAVDQQISHSGSDATAGRVVARTVTLEVTPEQAERVAVAMQLGRISLVVRSIEGVPEATGPRPSLVFGSDVSSALTGPQAPAPTAPRMRVIQGGTQQEVTFR